ncbi:hypothetical protein GCM10010440_00670 [Kitasatospora cinereorecta]
MTWMPESDGTPRRRRRSGSQSVNRQPEWPYQPYEPAGRSRRGGSTRLGIPRILGRRARWVGARLRREA